MKRLIRDLRIIPVVVFAAGCLLALKVIGISLEGGYILSDLDPAPGAAARAGSDSAASPPRLSWAQEMFGFQVPPSARKGGLPGSPAPAESVDTTGSVESKPADKPSDKAAAAAQKDLTGPVNPPKGEPDGKRVPVEGSRQPSPGERAVLERLQDRRQELDARAREMDIRENLLKATEKRLEARAAELKAIEARISGAAQKKEEAEAARFKNIVTMYENMKAKEAAKIFDRLDMKVLLEVSSQINARRMADILAQMSPEAAEKLTVELANRATGEKSSAATELPKIEGKPNGS